jgi:hypothetical protein
MGVYGINKDDVVGHVARVEELRNVLVYRNAV